MSEPTKVSIEVLSVEDNPGDSLIISELLEASTLFTKVTFVTDGVEAIEYLRRKGKFSDARRPDLILLDLSLPRKDGREVLREIKEDPSLKCIPVLVLSTSNAEKDVHLAYELHANAYFTKPSDLASFRLSIKAIEDFWSRAARPHSEPSAPHKLYA